MRLGVEAALVDGVLVPGDVVVEDGLVAGVGSDGGGRGIAVPGFVDLQVNGFAGVDFLGADADGYAEAGEALLETGVTGYLPTFITSDEADLLTALGAVPESAAGPRILGVHLEGPFISAARLGTHPPAARRDPDPLLLGRLLDAGPVRLMTLAPELPGAFDLVDILQARGVVVSLGHSDATARRPTPHSTAAFVPSRMSSTRCVRWLIAIRESSAPLSSARTSCCRRSWTASTSTPIRCGSCGTSPSAGSRSSRTRSRRRGSATALTALGSVDVDVRDGVARREDGVLAGSTLTMIQAVRNLIDLGVPLERAVEAASVVPARVLGLRGVGTTSPGSRADVVVLDDALEIDRVLVGGEMRVAG